MYGNTYAIIILLMCSTHLNQAGAATVCLEAHRALKRLVIVIYHLTALIKGFICMHTICTHNIHYMLCYHLLFPICYHQKCSVLFLEVK